MRAKYLDESKNMVTDLETVIELAKTYANDVRRVLPIENDNPFVKEILRTGVEIF